MYQASLGTVCVQIYSLLFPSSTLCPKKADSRELHFPRLLCQQAAGCWKIEGVERREPWRRESLPTPVFWPGEFHGLYVHEVAKSWTRLSNFFFHLFLLVGGKLLYNIVVVFVIHWHESALPIPPPTSLSTRFLWVFPVHQARALVSVTCTSRSQRRERPGHFPFPGGSDGKESAGKAGDPGSVPGSGRSPGEGNGTPLQYSCLENSMDRGALRASVHQAAKGLTRLSDNALRFRDILGQQLYLFHGTSPCWTDASCFLLPSGVSSF